MTRHRRRPRTVQEYSDAVTSARAAVRMKLDEELEWAEAYVEQLQVLLSFVTNTQAEIEERNEGKPHPRPNDPSRMEVQSP